VLYIPIGRASAPIVLDQVSSILLTLALTVAIVNAMKLRRRPSTGWPPELGPDHCVGHLHLSSIGPAARTTAVMSSSTRLAVISVVLAGRVPRLPAAQLPPPPRSSWATPARC